MTDIVPRVLERLTHPYKERGLTHDRLKGLLRYDPITGLFVWLVSKTPNGVPGEVAGSKNKANGYIYIGIDGKIYLAHYLAWFYQMGEWPSHEVDHRDLRHDNNKWVNLRPATPVQNCMNRPKRADSKNPYKGIRKKGNRWQACISINKKRKLLGTFATAEDAHQAYAAAARAHYGEFARAA